MYTSPGRTMASRPPEGSGIAFRYRSSLLPACDDNGTGKRLKDLVPESYLVKPFTRKELLAAISLVLQSYARKGGFNAQERSADPGERPEP
jgi:DNA-directed RNA polymerase